MAQQFDNEKRGVLFPNNRKQTVNHPDMTGSITIDGVEYFLDAWTKEKKDGSGAKFLSIRIGNAKTTQGQRPQQGQPQRPYERQSKQESQEADIPW